MKDGEMYSADLTRAMMERAHIKDGEPVTFDRLCWLVAQAIEWESQQARELWNRRQDLVDLANSDCSERELRAGVLQIAERDWSDVRLKPK